MLDDSRTIALLTEQAVSKLRGACVAVFGVGGVGSFAAEALVRAGVGSLILVDNDVVKPSNCNRQLVALNSTIGQKKVDVMAARAVDINPDVSILTYNVFYDTSTSDEIFSNQIDYVIDAIDSLASKETLILECVRRNIEIISSMGAGNKLYPERFAVTDIFKTSYDPIAKILRKRLRDSGVRKLRVVCSDEQPRQTQAVEDGKRVPASISFVPSVCGLLMAGAAVRQIAGIKE